MTLRTKNTEKKRKKTENKKIEKKLRFTFITIILTIKQ